MPGPAIKNSAIKAPDVIKTTRFWQVGYTLSLVNERYIMQLRKSTDARGASQLVARRQGDDSYALSVVYQPWKKKAPGKLRAEVVETGMSLDEVMDFMSAFERIGHEHDKHAPMPGEHRAANAAIGDTHITVVENTLREARLERAARPTQAKRLRRYRHHRPG